MKRKWKPCLCLCLMAGLLLLLCGCSERYKENERISKLAERYAEERAEAYILDKYGIDAQVIGYAVQGANVGMSWSAYPEVVVAMDYEGEEFCVLLNVDDETVLFDNRQKEEIGAVLGAYFLELYGLPAPVQSRLDFTIWGTFGSMTAWIGTQSYSLYGMVDFYYRGESAGELLERIESISYYTDFAELDRSLENLELHSEDWPSQKGFYFNAYLYRYPDQESAARFSGQHWSTDGPQAYDWPTLTEYKRLYLAYRASEPLLEDEFYAYHTAERDGLLFSGTLPFEADTCIGVSDEHPVWRVEKEWSQNTEVYEYEAISPLFFVVPVGTGAEEAEPEAPTARIACIVPRSYEEVHNGETLYVGKYDPEIGLVKIYEMSGGSPVEEIPPRRTAFQFEIAGTEEAFTAADSVQYAILVLKDTYTISPGKSMGKA